MLHATLRRLQTETLIVEPDISSSLHPRSDFPPEALAQAFGSAGYDRDSLIVVAMRERLVHQSTQIRSAGVDGQVLAAAASGGSGDNNNIIIGKQLLLFLKLDAVVSINSSSRRVDFVFGSCRGAGATGNANLQPLDETLLFSLIRRRDRPSDF